MKKYYYLFVLAMVLSVGAIAGPAVLKVSNFGHWANNEGAQVQIAAPSQISVANGAPAIDLSARSQAPKHTGKYVVANLDIANVQGLHVAGAQVADVKRPARAEGEWTVLGTGSFVDEIFTHATHEVTVEESTSKAGVYRVVDAWTAADANAAPLIIDASDPELVVIEGQATNVYNELYQGHTCLMSFSAEMRDMGFDKERFLQSYAMFNITMADGVITIPTYAMKSYYEDGVAAGAASNFANQAPMSLSIPEGQTTPEEPEDPETPSEEWTVLGTGSFVDEIFTHATHEVTVEESTSKAGVYRVVDAWTAADANAAPLIIDASDPELVVIEGQATNVYNELYQGHTCLMSFSAEMRDMGFDKERFLQSYAMFNITMADGVITIPTYAMKSYYEDGVAAGAASNFANQAPMSLTIPEAQETPSENWVDLGTAVLHDKIVIYADITVHMQQDANHPGMYRMVSPWVEGYDIVIDATNPACVKIAKQDTGLYESITESNMWLLNYAVYLQSNYGYSDDDIIAAIPSLVATFENGVFTFPARSLLAEYPDSNKYTDTYYAATEEVTLVMPGAVKPWEVIGYGQMLDGMVAPLFGVTNPSEIEVKIEQSTSTPGVYRITAPWRNVIETGGAALIVDASNPDLVVVDYQMTGINVNGRGETYIMSHSALMVNDPNNPEEAASYIANYSDKNITLKDGKIVFPAQSIYFNWPNFEGYENSLFTANSAIEGYITLPGSNTTPEWNNIGTGTWVEGSLDAVLDGCAGLKWSVEVEESATTSGVYRVAPYSDEDNDIVLGGSEPDVYVVFHCEDPEKVWIEPWTILEYYTFASLVPENGFDEFDCYGKLENGCVHFPANSMVLLYDDGEDEMAIYTNEAGMAGLALPGYDWVDYSLNVTADLCMTGGFITNVMVNAGADIATVKVIPSYAFINASNPTYAAIVAEEGDEIAVGEPTNIEIEELAPARYNLLVVGLDAEGAIRATADVPFFSVLDEEDMWKEAYEGEFTDIFAWPWYHNGNDEKVKVTVYEHVDIPGYFRIANPMSHSGMSNYAIEHAHGHYLYIHAEDPEFVWVAESPLGLYVNGTEGVAATVAGMLMNLGYDVDSARDVCMGGTMVDGVLSIPEESPALFGEYNSLGLNYYTTGSGEFLRLLNATGVENVTIEGIDAAAEYFNLQGIRVMQPEAGNIYIVRRGENVSKVLVK